MSSVEIPNLVHYHCWLSLVPPNARTGNILQDISTGNGPSLHSRERLVVCYADRCTGKETERAKALLSYMLRNVV